MNRHKLTITAFAGLIMFAAACKKNDLKYEAEKARQESAQTVSASQWKPVSQWNSSQQDQFTIHYGSFNDKAITAEVASKGLILVYKNKGGSTTALPAEEKGSKNAFWYYQVAEGSLLISADSYGADQSIDKNQSFQYFVFTPAQLKDLEAKGYPKSKLMKLSYSEALALVK